jgi:DNA-binding transcriptional LysR family regulator
MPGDAGRLRTWSFVRRGKSRSFEPRPRICVNKALMVHQLVAHGAGIGVLSGYLCEPELAAGRLVRVLPEWNPTPIDVSIVFPTRRELAPSVRAFVDFMKEINAPSRIWHDDRPARR